MGAAFFFVANSLILRIPPEFYKLWRQLSRRQAVALRPLEIACLPEAATVFSPDTIRGIRFQHEEEQ